MSISCQLLVLGILYLMPVAFMPQVLSRTRSLKLKWTGCEERTFPSTKPMHGAYRKRRLLTRNILLEDIDAALQAVRLQKVGMDENPSLLVGFSVGNKLVYVIQGYLKNPLVKQGSLVVELADPQLKKVVWWGVAEDTLTDDPGRDLLMIQKNVSKMFKKYPPPEKK
jgi:hypothetical protein